MPAAVESIRKVYRPRTPLNLGYLSMIIFPVKVFPNAEIRVK